MDFSEEHLKAFEAGTWGGEFNPEFGPQEGDVIIKEHWAQSGFANTDLDLQLKQHGIQKIVLVGLIANSCHHSRANLTLRRRAFAIRAGSKSRREIP